MLAYVFFVVVQNYIYLSSATYEISDEYNSYDNFKNTMRATYKFYARRFYKSMKFSTHYIELIFIKFVNTVMAVFEKIYKKMINRFLERSVENKSYVKFFWKDLKKFKKEIDSDK